MKTNYISPQVEIKESSILLNIICSSQKTPKPSKAFFEVGVNNEGYQYPLDGTIETEDGGEAGSKYRGLYNDYDE